MPSFIGVQGILVLLLVVVLIFGTRRLPELGRALGRGMREFKDSIGGRGEVGVADDD
jgi:sec-independent protein translocase protein TatA